MMGSLTLYRGLLRDHVFSKPWIRAITPGAEAGPSGAETTPKLPSIGHGIAGMGAGTTVSIVAAPLEHVKSRLQTQYSADKKQRLFSGPIDCTRKIVSTHSTYGVLLALPSALSDVRSVAPFSWNLWLVPGFICDSHFQILLLFLVEFV
jgi:solute carrier family 25 (mitochondrial carnitine/acylcarnitine transporter), member 20/29